MDGPDSLECFETLLPASCWWNVFGPLQGFRRAGGWNQWAGLFGGAFVLNQLSTFVKIIVTPLLH